MRIVFAGSSVFAVAALKALNDSKHELMALYCPPDKPKGRGRMLAPCATKVVALKYGLNTHQPQDLTNIETQKQLTKLNADVMVVVAYGKVLPEAILRIPKYGCLNIHASILPRWRGAAPIQRAILAGDNYSGISIIKMNRYIDAGDVLLIKKCRIENTDSAQKLHDKLAVLGVQGIMEVLDSLTTLSPCIQNQNKITYAKKLSKDEAWINWKQTAEQINRQILAFNPYPIAQTKATAKQFDNKILRILQAEVIAKNSDKKAGQVINHNKDICDIATIDSTIRLKKVQLAGKKPVLIKDFSNAYKLIKLS